MKSIKVWKWILTGAILLIALFLLYPTFELGFGNPDPETAQKLRKRSIKVGLDLKGGTHLVMELDRTKIPEGHEGDPIEEAIEIIRNRVDQFGVAEPTIQREGENRIIIELPGVKDPVMAKEIIGKTALLEFKLLRSQTEIKSFVDNLDKLLANSQRLKGILAMTKEDEIPPVDTTTKVTQPVIETKPESAKVASAKTDTSKTKTEGAKVTKGAQAFNEKDTKITDTTSALAEEDIEKPFSAIAEIFGDVIAIPVSEYYGAKLFLSQPEVKALISEGVQLAWSGEEKGPQGIKYRYVYLLNTQTRLTGTYLNEANFSLGSPNDPDSPGKPIVNLKFNKIGAKIFSEITGANIEKKLAIVLDSTVFSAPTIKVRIRDGQARITGIGDLDEAKTLSIVLRAGALPAPLIPLEERSVGPSLGEDSIRKGVLASLIGLIFVVVFMIFYYRISGIIANVALILNLVLLLAAMALVNATVTLPGIAGIILSLGMAVDANVLIFERIREELRAGKSVGAAIDAGYSNAFRTILDSNLTTLIAGIVLYKFGTGPIKGFAVSLSFGIVISMFTAIFVTRIIQNYLLITKRSEKLSI